MTTKFELPMCEETARDLLGIAWLDDMTDEERTLIEACKLAFGHTWKSKISIMWSTGDYYTISAKFIPGLQRLRNTRGVKWLYWNA